jgi:tRNA dimethylallyltransferase
LDLESYHQIDIKNPQRVVRALEVSLQTGRPFSSFKSHVPKVRSFEITKEGLMRDRSELYARINARVDEMMKKGLLEEAQVLWPCKELPALRTVGYKELFDYFDGKCTLESAILMIKQNSRHYAKRQCSYWRRDKMIKWMFV